MVRRVFSGTPSHRFASSELDAAASTECWTFRTGAGHRRPCSRAGSSGIDCPEATTDVSKTIAGPRNATGTKVVTMPTRI